MPTKYLSLLSRALSQAIQFRAEMLLWLVLDIIPVLVLFLVWQSIIQPGEVINGFTLSGVITYHFLGMVINALASTHFEHYRAEQIRLGKIDHFLLKPLSFPAHILVSDISRKLFFLTLSLPLFTVVYLWIAQTFALAVPTLSLWVALQFLVLLISTYCIEFLIAFIVVTLTFWFEGAEGLEHFKWIVITMLSGVLIPLAFMPAWLRSAVEVLPFKYMYAVPIEIILGRTTLTLTDCLYLGSFIIGLALIARALWYRGVLSYTSAGG